MSSRRVGLLIALFCMASAVDALAASPASMDWTGAYDNHPMVQQVRRLGHLSPELRIELIQSPPPVDRLLAIISAMSRQQAKAFRVADSLLWSLAAHKALDDTRASALTLSQLTPQQALLIGWSRARENAAGRSARPSAQAFAANARQLLQRATDGMVNHQAPHLALALYDALKNKEPKASLRCASWLEVQKQARTPRKASVALPQAEAAIAAVSHLARACRRSQRKAYLTAIQLPAPPPEVRVERATNQGPKTPVDSGGRGVAFAVAAPIFRGYMDLPAVRDVLRVRRLPSSRLRALLEHDKTGDLSVAVINAAVLTRRISPKRVHRTLLREIRRRHKGSMPLVRDLGAVEAVALGYAKALAGQGFVVTRTRKAARVDQVGPLALFRHARDLLTPSARLSGLMRLAHLLDLAYAGSPCAALERAKSTIFVIRKSQLPSAAHSALVQAVQTMIKGCHPEVRSK
ncbi:MAG TPA: hypothetical protein DCQ06_13315 [Myxococcales bacterium]|nr:hypothetical protein [Myxococcales bacterium]